jgi:flagellar protein FliJ
MKRYKFRLDQVLRVRRMEEEQARAALLAANAELNRAGERLRDRTERYHTMVAPIGPSQLTEFLAWRQRHEAAATAVIDAGTAVESATSQAAESRDGWSAAAARVTALERLDERRRAEHAAEAEREFDQEIDDLVTSRHGRHM